MESLKELKAALLNVIDQQALLKAVVPAAPVLALIMPVLRLINTIFSFALYYSLSSIWYLLYLVGIIICFAADVNWALGAAFGLKALSYLIYFFFGSASLNNAVYLVFYGVLAFIFLKPLIGSKKSE